MFPRGNSYARGNFIGRKIDADGNSVGRTNDNPILDIREYCVDFDDGEVIELTENGISDFMYAACNESGNEYLMIDSIVNYHKSNKAISVSSQKVVHRDQSFMCRSTVGWQICIQWKEGSTAWQDIKDMKESHPVDRE